MGASRMSSRFAPRRLIVLGFLFIAAGAGLLIITIDRTFDPVGFAGSVLVVGIGLGHHPLGRRRDHPVIGRD